MTEANKAIFYRVGWTSILETVRLGSGADARAA